jgi:molecular chaperone DnaK
MAADNKSLGTFHLDGIPPSPRGVPQIEVSYDIDASGILNVSAKDKATGKSQSIRITGSTGLSKDEIAKMQKEAEAHSDEDKQVKEKIEVKNQADSLIYTSEKALRDGGDKVKPEIKIAVEEKIKALKDILEKGEKQEIETKTKELSDALSKVGEAMYQKPDDKTGRQEDGKTGGQEDNKTSGDNQANGEKKTNGEAKVEEGKVVE